MSKEAMKLALEALEFNCVMSDDGEDLTPMKIKKATKALREALAEQPAPVHHFDHTAAANAALRDAQDRSYQVASTITITRRGSTRTIDNHFEDCVRDWPDGEYKLYTSPPTLSLAQRKPLTEEEMEKIAAEYWLYPRKFVRAIEAAHGIKENT